MWKGIIEDFKEFSNSGKLSKIGNVFVLIALIQFVGNLYPHMDLWLDNINDIMMVFGIIVGIILQWKAKRKRNKNDGTITLSNDGIPEWRN